MKAKKTKILKIFPLIVLLLLFAAAPHLSAQGKIELGFHYGSWSIDLLRGVIEEGLSDALKSDLKDQFLEDIQQDYPNLTESSYSQNVSFDSSGSNFGFDIRWYPGGQTGSFSIGLSVEKTSMKVALPEISADLVLSDGSTFQANSNGEFLIKPLSFHLSLRWDIKPSWRVHPYITFGLGAATGTALENAELTYSYSGTLSIAGDTESYSGGETRTLIELKDELEAEGEDFFLPGFIPFIQLNLGVRGQLTDNLALLVDAGIWNGFLLRGGVAFRF